MNTAALDARRRLEQVNKQVNKLSWRAAGRCFGISAEIFYPPGDDDELAEDAKAICSLCCVRQTCLEHALTTGEKHGVWGGMTERERRRLLRQRRKSA